VRFVHLCTADAAFASEAAMRIVALFFMQDFELANRIAHRLILYRRASHKVNLAVQFAICRQRLRNPMRSHRLCCNAVRLFKYLTPPYADHFGMQLRDHIIRGFEVFERAALPDDQRPDYGLRRLYGDDVITPEIAKLLNVDFHRLEMACPPGAELREMRGLLHSELYRSIVRVENHPVAQVTTELCDALANLHHDASLDLTDTVLSLLRTTVHVCLRFGDYNVFNYLWEMTLKYNPDECVNACGVFLRTPASRLGGGYGVLLQLEALQYPTLPEQLDFLLGDSVQEELVDIVNRMGHDSLDAERKNHQDRRSAKNHGTTTLARGSRNGMLREFRTWRLRHLSEAAQNKRVEKYLKMGPMACAVQEMPHLMPRGRGKLHWGGDVPTSVQKQLTFAGDRAALERYLADNRERLAAKAAALCARAKAAAICGPALLPVTNKNWLDWMAANEAVFAEVGNNSWAVELLQVPGGPEGVLMLDCNRLDRACKPMGAIVLGAGGHWQDAAEPEMYALTVSVDRVDKGRVYLQAVDHSLIEVVPPPPKRSGADDTPCEDSSSDDDEGDAEASEVDAETEDEASLLDDMESAADVDSDAVSHGGGEEGEAETEGDVDDAGDAPAEPVAAGPAGALPGTHVLWNNGNFYLSHYGVDAKMYICPTWAEDDQMGRKLKSKTQQLAEHGGMEATIFALRAWMIYRSQQNDWHRRCPARLAWHRGEVAALRRDIQGWDLRAATRNRLRDWAPEMLA
ncbi:unnamed protein product, partial [Prorocentrum cordatum]